MNNPTSNKRYTRKLSFIFALVLFASVSILVAGKSKHSDVPSSSLGTIYSLNSASEQVIAYDAGHSYILDKEGHVSISYHNGKSIAKAPLSLYPDANHEESGMTVNETGFYISTVKTAITYGGFNKQPVQVLITDDMGKTWNTYTVTKESTGSTKFIGFTSKSSGWIVLSSFRGMGSESHTIYKTQDGGKTWREVKGNLNEVYSRVMTGAGFANEKIGFMSYRYETEFQPAICWTQDGGLTWTKLHVKLPIDLTGSYSLTPLSPVFDGATGKFPILLSRDGASDVVGTVYLTSTNYGKTWTYDPKLTKFK